MCPCCALLQSHITPASAPDNSHYSDNTSVEGRLAEKCNYVSMLLKAFDLTSTALIFLLKTMTNETGHLPLIHSHRGINPPSDGRLSWAFPFFLNP